MASMLSQAYKKLFSRGRRRSAVQPFGDVVVPAAEAASASSRSSRPSASSKREAFYGVNDEAAAQLAAAVDVDCPSGGPPPEIVPEARGTCDAAEHGQSLVCELCVCRERQLQEESQAFWNLQLQLERAEAETEAVKRAAEDRQTKLEEQLRNAEARLQEFERPSERPSAPVEPVEERRTPSKRKPRERTLLRGASITFNEKNEVINVAISGNMRTCRTRDITGHAAIGFGRGSSREDVEPKVNFAAGPEKLERQGSGDSGREIRDRIPTGYKSLQDLVASGEYDDEDDEGDDAWDTTAFDRGRSRVPRGLIPTGHFVINYKGGARRSNPNAREVAAQAAASSAASRSQRKASLGGQPKRVSFSSDEPQTDSSITVHAPWSPELSAAEPSPPSLPEEEGQDPRVRARRSPAATAGSSLADEALSQRVESGYFGRSAGCTDGQEEIGPPSPKGGNQTSLGHVRRQYEEQLTVLCRYSMWRRSLSRRRGPCSSADVCSMDAANPVRSSVRDVEAQAIREPVGQLVKGVGTSETITHADISLLSEAMPLAVSSLGIGAEVAAFSFRAFYVEAGKEIWREDTPIEHVYIVGDGTSLSISRDGRQLRDVGVGQNFGAEALQGICRWQNTAVVRRAGQVWAMDAMAFRELNFQPEVRALLSESPVFKTTTPIQLILLAAHAENTELQQDDHLFRNGDRGSIFYVLKSGAVSIVKDGLMLRTYSTVGQAFGEKALLQKGYRRSSSCVAIEAKTMVCGLSTDLLCTVFGESMGHVLNRNIVHQTFRAEENVDFHEVKQDSLELWSERCVVHNFDSREDILEKVKRTDADFGGLMVVLHGEVHAMPSGDQADADSCSSAIVYPYQVLGRDHLIEAPEHWLQALTAGDEGVSIAVLPKKWWKQVFMGCSTVTALAAFQRRIELLRKVFLFRHLSEQQRVDLVSSMTFATKKKGDVVIREGDNGADFFLIHEGDVAVSKNNNFITKLSQPAYFGERALLYEEPRAATVIVTSEEATFCVLTKQLFLEILSNDILDFITYRNKLLDTDLQFSDLEEQKVIGRGGYGIVKLVRHKKSGTRYALKCVTRDKLSDWDRSLVQRERAIMQLIDHPFCLKLVRSFKDSNCVYFLTELVTGGELLDVLDRLDVLTKPQAQFYLGSLLAVFEYIHEKNIIYRDLKPENVLLDSDGFVKLIDFGAARQLDNAKQKCFTLLGTPHFMAVEMVLAPPSSRYPCFQKMPQSKRTLDEAVESTNVNVPDEGYKPQSVIEPPQKRPRTDTTTWRVARCGAKDKAMRDAQGASYSVQSKIDCLQLEVTKDGVIGRSRGWFGTSFGSRQLVDFNNYRTRGHPGKFEPCTLDRAVTIVTSSAYEALRKALPGAPIKLGDLGENLLLNGPLLREGAELHVGARLRIGEQVVLELTEANRPCRRLSFVKWSKQAERIVGEKAWWKSEKLTLGEHCPGGRGWLCRVLVEGIICPGDNVEKLNEAVPCTEKC